MPCRLTPSGGVNGVSLRAWGAVLAALVVTGMALPARGDVLHLKSGGSIEGSIVERDGQRYKVRTLVGTVTVPADAVVRIEEKPSVLDEYVQRRGQVAETPAAQFELAQWCEEQGLKSAWRTHLKRAIELDADYEPARKALGFVRVGGMWVEGRSVADRPESIGEEKQASDPDAAGKDSEKVIAAIQSQWNVRIRAIKMNKLLSGSDRLVRAGRAGIVEIRDPLAILPLVRVLGDGNWACREALVSVLSHFPQDEATMHLAILALVDRDEGIRRQALVELKRRDDPRVIPQFRRALSTDNDEVIKQAAVGLGLLEATAAVPDLIDLLTARRDRMVEISTRTYFGDYVITFDTPTVISLGSVSHIRHHPVLGLPALGTGLVFVNREYQLRNVTVLRTEVMEALKQITGQNFGFDAAEWRRWYEEQLP
ncbi:MAG: HEAT repeat domain-containing protein [Planctomycetes bacterium]|nr:HEAT repeat domain-containing protein [Planctomycetota bacterium]